MKRLSPLVWLLFLILIGCKSAPGSSTVNPLDLLDGENDVYFVIPVRADPELVVNVLQSNVSNLSESDAKAILNRIDSIYAGISYFGNKMALQCAVSCDIPTAFHSKIFSKKNGWEVAEYAPAGSKKSFNLYENGGLTISLPDAKTLCLGRDVTKMLDTYQFLATPISKADGAAKTNGNAGAEGEGYIAGDFDEVLDVNGENPYMEEAGYVFLGEAFDSVRFFTRKPQVFLKLITGVSLDLKLSYIMGEIKNNLDADSQYSIDLDFQFKNERFVKPGKALLAFAFSLADSNVTISSRNLRISGIKMEKKRIYDILDLK